MENKSLQFHHHIDFSENTHSVLYSVLKTESPLRVSNTKKRVYLQICGLTVCRQEVALALKICV